MANQELDAQVTATQVPKADTLKARLQPADRMPGVGW